MAYSLIATSIIGQIINSWPNRKLLNYSYLDQVNDMLPQILLSCFMGIVVFSVHLLNLTDLTTVAIQVPLGIIIYIVGSKGGGPV